MSVRVACDDMEAFGFVMFGGLPLDSLRFRFGAMARNGIDALENDTCNVPASFVNGLFEADVFSGFNSFFAASWTSWIVCSCT